MESVLLKECKGSQDVCIAFSARDTEVGKFTFYKVVQDLPAHIIFINDFANNWYLNGTPEFASREVFVSWLQQEIDRLRGPNGRLFTMGSSMGGYAALLYGSLLQADRILALGPESELCIPLGRSVTSMLFNKEGDEDISRLHFKDPAQVLIISGNNDIVDMYCAARFHEGNPDLNIRLICNRTHVVAKYLDAQFGLATIVRDHFIGGDTSFLQRAECCPVPDVATARALKDFNQALTLDKQVLTEHAAVLRRVADDCSQWSMPAYFYALVLEEQGQVAEAEQYLQRALAAQSSLGRAALKLARLYCADGRFAQAEVLLQELVDSNPTWPVIDLLWQCHKGQGRMLAALKLLLQTEYSLLRPGEIPRYEKRLRETRAAVQHPPRSAPRLLRRVADLAGVLQGGEQLTWSASEVHVQDDSATLHLGARCCISNARIELGSHAQLHIGDDVQFSGEIRVGAGASVRLGHQLQVLERADLYAAPATRIALGRDCVIESCTVHTADAWRIQKNDSGEELNAPADVLVGDGVWLGAGSRLLAGTHLGHGCLVEAAAVVRLDLPQGSCQVAGNPAQVVQQDIAWSWRSARRLVEQLALTAAAIEANSRNMEWCVAHLGPLLRAWSELDASHAPLLQGAARILLEQAQTRKACGLELQQLHDAVAHMNRLQGNEDTAGIKLQRDVLLAMDEPLLARVFNDILPAAQRK